MIVIDIKDIIDNLNLISNIIPDYSEGRNRGLSDDETETLALESISQAAEALENIKIKIKEYIIIVDNEIFRVYGLNELEAIFNFTQACFEFKNTNNEEYQKYWNDLKNLVLANQYTIIENTDFRGIRKVI